MRTETANSTSPAGATHPQANGTELRLERSRDDIARDLRHLVSQSQLLLADIGALTSDQLDESLAALRMRLADAGAKATLLADAAQDHGRRYARLTDDYVHANPWRVIAGAGLAALVVGMLLMPRRD